MKSFRVCYYTAIAGFYLAGKITGRREIFLLFFVMLFVLIYALALNVWTFFSFSFVQELSEASSVKGKTVMLKIGIYNDKPFPFTMMRINVETACLGENAVLSFNLSPKKHIYFDVPLHCAYRGVYNVGMTTLEVNDIFGLLHIRYDLRRLSYYRQKKLTIYPCLVILPFLPAQIRDAKLWGGALRLSEEGSAFSDLRAYRAGDTSKRIHWKVSASKRELVVKNYDAPAENAVMIAIDSGENSLSEEDALHWADLACELSAMIAHYSLRSGYAVTLMDSSQSPAIKSISQQDFAKIYNHLAVMPFGSDMKEDIAQKVKKSCDALTGFTAVYIITRRHDIPFCEGLKLLSGSGYSVKCLMPGLTREEAHAAGAMMPGVSCVSIALGKDAASALEDAAIL